MARVLKKARTVSDGKLKGLKSPYAVDFHVAISGTEPIVWRKIRLSDDMTLDDFHGAIQGSFGWENSHLHAFRMSRRRRYSGIETDEMDPFADEQDDSNSVTIKMVVALREKKFIYEYDFGDSWNHEIKIVSVEPLAKALRYPECIDGERCGPPEDCGGIHGFESFKEIMADPKNEEHTEMKEWYGGRFNPEWFSVADANKRIRSFFK
jgi:hypothetical protein